MKLVFLFLISICASAAEPQWELIREQMGIRVYKKIFEDKSLIAFRGIGVVEAPLPVVANTVLSQERARKLSNSLLTTKTLEWIEYPTKYIEYNEIAMPLWLTTRDFISKVVLTYDKQEGTLLVSYEKSESAKYQTPINPANILGEIQGSRYKLTPINDGKHTVVDGSVLADPRGSIPKWIVNFFQADWPYDTIQSLRYYSTEAGKVIPMSKHVKDLLK